MRQIYFQCIGAIIALLGTINAFPQSNNQSVEAYKHSNSVYDEFRTKYPFHFQCIGKAEYPDKSCLFLISEPSPAVTENAIRKVFGSSDYSLQIKQQKLGYDGYIKDVIIAVSSVTHDQVIKLEKTLHRLLFSSDYKAERATLQLPVSEERKFFSSKSLNYQVSLAELHNWFINNKDKELFLMPNNQNASVSSLLKNSQAGVYLSDKPGFVAWVINKNEDLSKQKPSIRNFVLDSDLILGAFSNAQKLIIIGRERDCSVSELPPLCTETILMLASCSQPQLSQSLDIMDVLAGKITSRNIDWCPTYLSDELENTEYGNLLTITDLILKGWSEAGQMEDSDFDYPLPSRYPFTKPLLEILQDKQLQSAASLGINTIFDNSLVYNWNTEGAIYSMKMPDYSIYAISSTGALPVSYFNDQHSAVSIGKDYEQKAYDYFANINNTDLARVVQYQTLYSIFFDNQLFLATPLPSYSQNAKQYLLEKYTNTILVGLKDISSTQKTNLARNLAIEFVSKHDDSAFKEEIKRARQQFEESIQEKIKQEGLSPTDWQAKQYRNTNLEKFEKNADEWILQNKNAWTSQIEVLISQKIDEVQQLLKRMSDKKFTQTCRYMSYPRGNNGVEIVNEDEIIQLLNGITGLSVAGIFKSEVYSSFGVDLAQVMDYYSQSLKSESSRWIKTPTLTRTFEGYHAVGGHNLLASMKRVKTLTEYMPRFNRENFQINVRPREEIIPSISRVHRGL